MIDEPVLERLLRVEPTIAADVVDDLLDRSARVASDDASQPVERVDQHFAVVGEEYGLGVDLPDGLEPTRLLELMRRDKKALDGLTFVLDGPNGVEVVAGVDDEPVLEALDRMAR